jgi:hypothetical protein
MDRPGRGEGPSAVVGVDYDAGWPLTVDYNLAHDGRRLPGRGGGYEPRTIAPPLPPGRALRSGHDSSDSC